jgi:hypothetical protein
LRKPKLIEFGENKKLGEKWMKKIDEEDKKFSSVLPIFFFRNG